MSINLDSHQIELSCPSCSEKFKEQIGRLKDNPTLTCPGCGQAIKIQADQLRRSIDEVQKSLDSFGKSLGKLFK